jgi:hypothetical protein
MEDKPLSDAFMRIYGVDIKKACALEYGIS